MLKTNFLKIVTAICLVLLGVILISLSNFIILHYVNYDRKYPEAFRSSFRNIFLLISLVSIPAFTLFATIKSLLQPAHQQLYLEMIISVILYLFFQLIFGLFNPDTISGIRVLIVFGILALATPLLYRILVGKKAVPALHKIFD